MNQTLVHLLRRYNQRHPKTWDDNVPYIQHCYNRAIHSSTNQLPFEVCLGFLPQRLFIYNSLRLLEISLSKLVTNDKRMLSLLPGFNRFIGKSKGSSAEPNNVIINVVEGRTVSNQPFYIFSGQINK